MDLYAAFLVYWPLRAHYNTCHITHIHALMAEAAMWGANCSSGAMQLFQSKALTMILSSATRTLTLVPVSNTIAGMVMITASSGSESVKEATKQDSYSNCQINDIKYNGRQRETHWATLPCGKRDIRWKFHAPMSIIKPIVSSYWNMIY